MASIFSRPQCVNPNYGQCQTKWILCRYVVWSILLYCSNIRWPEELVTRYGGHRDLSLMNMQVGKVSVLNNVRVRIDIILYGIFHRCSLYSFLSYLDKKLANVVASYYLDIKKTTHTASIFPPMLDAPLSKSFQTMGARPNWFNALSHWLYPRLGVKWLY